MSQNNLKTRDGERCQYCGRVSLDADEFWTRDHVFPTSRGGENIWENVVLSCNTCNNRKSDRTPEEAGMVLLQEPRKPTRWQLETLKTRKRGMVA